MGRRKRLNKEKYAEDWCFFCKDGGSLRICDYKTCLKSYHPQCAGKDDSLLVDEKNWTCDWHFCCVCKKTPKFYCLCCPSAVCGRCMYTTEFSVIRRDKGLCKSCLLLAQLVEEGKVVELSTGEKRVLNENDKLELFFSEYLKIIKRKQRLTSKQVFLAYNNMLKRDENCSRGFDTDDLEDGEEDLEEFEDESLSNISEYDSLTDTDYRKMTAKRKRSIGSRSVGKNELRTRECVASGSVVEVQKSSFALIVQENIKLAYLRKSLVEIILKQIEKFDAKVIGSFVRVKFDRSDHLEKNAYQLVQVTGTKRTSSMNAEILLHVSNTEKEVSISKLSDDDFTKEECEDLFHRMEDGLLKRPTVVELHQKASILHKDITKHWIARELVSLQNLIEQANERNCMEDIVKNMNSLLLLETPSEQLRLLNQVPKVIAHTHDPEPAHEDSKTEEEHDVGSLNITDVAAPASEPLTSNSESDQEAATVNETTEVRNLLAEETAEEPAPALEPGVAPISSSFQDQDAAASIQSTVPPLTTVQIPPPPDNSAESCPLTTASLPTSPPPFLTPLVAPQLSFLASARNLAMSVPSTNLETEDTAQASFSTIGDARIFFAKLENMLDDSLDTLPGCSQQPTIRSHEINDAKEFIRRCCLMGFEHLICQDQREKFLSSLMLLMSIDYFPIDMLDMVMSFRTKVLEETFTYSQCQQSVRKIENVNEQITTLKEELSSKHSHFVQLMRDIKVATKEKEEITKQLKQKNERIASLEEQARSLAESSRTSKNALSQYHCRSDGLEKDRQECKNIMNGIDASWDNFRTEMVKLI